MYETVGGDTRVIGLFGHPVHHSLSPAMQNTAFKELALNLIYISFDVHPENLEAAVQGIRALNMLGANVTIPHKEQVIRFLDRVDDEARKIGSVNTIHNVDGVLTGYSTDGRGFIESLEASGKSASGSRAVLLGAGGSARAIAYALASRGSKVTIANRTFARAQELAEKLNSVLGSEIIHPLELPSEEARRAVAEADLLVNCTSVGMYPSVNEQPIPSEWLHSGLFVYDQIYNPLETRLLNAAKAAGAKTANGVGMLVFQGAESIKIWTSCTAPVRTMEQAVLAGLKSGNAAKS